MKIIENIKDIITAKYSVQRIMSGGGIVWQKPYKWKVYTVLKTNIYKYRLDIVKHQSGNNPFSFLTIYEKIDINPNTGIIYGTKETHVYGSNYGQYFGYIIEDNVGYYVDCFDGYCTKYDIYKPIKYIYETNKVKGNFLKEISSANKNEYPKNGVKGDYWYELVE